MTCELVGFELSHLNSRKVRNKSEAFFTVRLPAIKVEKEKESSFVRKPAKLPVRRKKIVKLKTMNIKSPLKITDLTDKVFRDIPKFVIETSIVTPKLRTKKLGCIDSPKSEENWKEIKSSKSLKKNNMILCPVRHAPGIIAKKESEKAMSYVKEYGAKKDKGTFNRAISPWAYRGISSYSVFM